MPTMVLTEVEKKEVCARIAHEANRTYCRSLSDESQKVWEEAPQWQRESVRLGVEGVLAGATATVSHESWLYEKQRTGWKWGPVKDEQKKEHPCMVRYEELPPDQRIKDVLFVQVVRGAAQALQLEVRTLRARGGG